MGDGCSDGDKQDTILGLPVTAFAGIVAGAAGLGLFMLFFCLKARNKRKREEAEYEYYTATTDPAAAVPQTSSHKRHDSFESFKDTPQPPPQTSSSWSKNLPDSHLAPLISSSKPFLGGQAPLPPQLPGRPGYHGRSPSQDYPAPYGSSPDYATTYGAGSRYSSSSYDSYSSVPATKPKKGNKSTSPPLLYSNNTGTNASPMATGPSSRPLRTALKNSSKRLLSPGSPHKSDATPLSPSGTAPPAYNEVNGLASPALSDGKKKRWWPFGGSSSGNATPAMPSTATGTGFTGGTQWMSAGAPTPQTYASSEVGSSKMKGRPEMPAGAPTITVTHPSRGNSLSSTKFMASSYAPSTNNSYMTGSAISGPSGTSFAGGSSWQGGGLSTGPATTVGGGSSWHPGAASSYQGSSNYAPTVKSGSSSKRAYQTAGPSTAPGSRLGGYAESAGGSSYKTSGAAKTKGLGAPSSFGGSSWHGQGGKGAPSTFYTGGSSWQGGGGSSAGAGPSTSLGLRSRYAGSEAGSSSTSSSKRAGKK